MQILFLHGWQSIPGGVKPTFLTTNGHTVINPKLPDEQWMTVNLDAEVLPDFVMMWNQRVKWDGGKGIVASVKSHGQT